MRPRVSILMNCYNCRKYLVEAIESIYAQDYGDWEIVFVDNCSEDGSAEIANGYDDRLRYIRTPSKMELGAARNFGLSRCRGEYLAFLDTDDIWMPGKLGMQVDMLDRNRNYAMCYGGVVYIDENGNEGARLIPEAKSGRIFPQLLKRYEINMQSVLLRLSGDLKFDETKQFSPDYDMFMKRAAKYEVGVIKSILVKYRKLEGSLTAKKMDRWWVEMKETLDEIASDDPELTERYPREYRLAYAKAAYYRARYLMSEGDRVGASRVMKAFRYASPVYWALYMLTLSPALWDLIHRYR